MKRVLVIVLSCVATLSITATPSKASTHGGGDGLPCDTVDEIPTYADVVYGEPLPGALLKTDIWVPPGTSKFPTWCSSTGRSGPATRPRTTPGR